MNKNDKLKSTISTIIMIIASFFIIGLLHDISKAIIGVICNGTLRFDHGIKVSNAHYGSITYPLNLLIGIIIPILFLFILVLIFNNSLRNGVYHKFTLIFFICSVLSISIYLIFYPLILTFTNLGLHTELDDLIKTTGISPLIIIIIAILIVSLLVKLAAKKRLFRHMKGTN